MKKKRRTQKHFGASIANTYTFFFHFSETKHQFFMKK